MALGCLFSVFLVLCRLDFWTVDPSSSYLFFLHHSCSVSQLSSFADNFLQTSCFNFSHILQSLTSLTSDRFPSITCPAPVLHQIILVINILRTGPPPVSICRSCKQPSGSMVYDPEVSSVWGVLLTTRLSFWPDPFATWTNSKPISRSQLGCPGLIKLKRDPTTRPCH